MNVLVNNARGTLGNPIIKKDTERNTWETVMVDRREVVLFSIYKISKPVWIGLVIDNDSSARRPS